MSYWIKLTAWTLLVAPLVIFAVLAWISAWAIWAFDYESRMYRPSLWEVIKFAFNGMRDA